MEIEFSIQRLELKLEQLKKVRDYRVEGGTVALDAFGCIHPNCPAAQEERRKFGMAFKTHDDAQEAFYAFKDYHLRWKLAKHYNGTWRPDWNDPKQKKVGVRYDHKDKEWNTWLATGSVEIPGALYMKCHETADKVASVLQCKGEGTTTK